MKYYLTVLTRRFTGNKVMGERILKWGLLGTARINADLILPVRDSERHDVVAVASRTKEGAESYAREWNIKSAHGSYESLLADSDVDVVYNSLPNGLHAEWCVKAALAGKHVLCEKPMALTLQQMDEIQDAAESSSVIVTEAFMYRHHEQTLQVKALMDGGAVGQLRVLQGQYGFNIGDGYDVRLDAALGGGCMWDMGCYPVSYARYMVGTEPQEVFGWGWVGASGVEEMFVGQMRFQNDIFAQFTTGFRMPKLVVQEIMGDQGMLRVSNVIRASEGDTVTISCPTLAGDGEVQSFSFPNRHVFSDEIEDLGDAVLHGKNPRVSLSDSRNNLASILALLESSRTGQPIVLRG